MSVSEWANERFGTLAADLVEIVPKAVKQAHEYAAAAQGSGGTRHLDPYGHTLKNTQHECLVDALRKTPGTKRFQPHGASFELIQLTTTHVTLLPWRYGTNSKASRLKVRMRPSGLRRDLLSGPKENPNQYSLEQADLSEAELEAQMAEHDAVWSQLRRMARVVTIGFASSPHGIYDLGWGEVELVDDNGTVNWLHWEPLALVEGSAAGKTESRGHLRAVTAPDQGERSVGPRFDDLDAGDDDRLLLRPRAAAGEPSHETQPPVQETGTDGEVPDEPQRP